MTHKFIVEVSTRFGSKISYFATQSGARRSARKHGGIVREAVGIGDGKVTAKPLIDWTKPISTEDGLPARYFGTLEPGKIRTYPHVVAVKLRINSDFEYLYLVNNHGRVASDYFRIVNVSAED